MIFKNTAIAFFLPLVSGSFWSIPTNIKFDISYYNSSNCTYEPVNNTRLIFYCGFEENTINEIPQCCYDEINKLVPLSNPEFNKCYDFETFGNHTYTKYNCDFAKLNETTTVEVFGFIGVVLLFILSVVIFVSLFRVCLRNNSYARV